MTELPSPSWRFNLKDAVDSGTPPPAAAAPDLELRPWNTLLCSGELNLPVIWLEVISRMFSGAFGKAAKLLELDYFPTFDGL